MKEQGIWNEEKEEKLANLRIEIADNLEKIDKGGIKLSEAKLAAMKVRELRTEINICYPSLLVSRIKRHKFLKI